jgi:hypothetical protein
MNLEKTSKYIYSVLSAYVLSLVDVMDGVNVPARLGSAPSADELAYERHIAVFAS